MMEFHYSKIKVAGHLFALVLLIIFLVYALLLIPMTNLTLMMCGWPIVALLMVILAMNIPIFFNNEPQVVINNFGIHNKRQKVGLIPWDNIQAIHIKPYYVRGIRIYFYMVIETKNPETNIPHIPQALKAATSSDSPFAISFHLLKPSLKDAIAFIDTRYPGKIRKSVNHR